MFKQISVNRNPSENLLESVLFESKMWDAGINKNALYWNESSQTLFINGRYLRNNKTVSVAKLLVESHDFGNTLIKEALSTPLYENFWKTSRVLEMHYYDFLTKNRMSEELCSLTATMIDLYNHNPILLEQSFPTSKQYIKEMLRETPNWDFSKSGGAGWVKEWITWDDVKKAGSDLVDGAMNSAAGQMAKKFVGFLGKIIGETIEGLLALICTVVAAGVDNAKKIFAMVSGSDSIAGLIGNLVKSMVLQATGLVTQLMTNGAALFQKGKTWAKEIMQMTIGFASAMKPTTTGEWLHLGADFLGMLPPPVGSVIEVVHGIACFVEAGVMYYNKPEAGIPWAPIINGGITLSFGLISGAAAIAAKKSAGPIVKELTKDLAEKGAVTGFESLLTRLKASPGIIKSFTEFLETGSKWVMTRIKGLGKFAESIFDFLGGKKALAKLDEFLAFLKKGKGKTKSVQNVLDDKIIKTVTSNKKVAKTLDAIANSKIVKNGESLLGAGNSINTVYSVSKMLYQGLDHAFTENYSINENYLIKEGSEQSGANIASIVSSIDINNIGQDLKEKIKKILPNISDSQLNNFKINDILNIKSIEDSDNYMFNILPNAIYKLITNTELTNESNKLFEAATLSPEVIQYKDLSKISAESLTKYYDAIKQVNTFTESKNKMYNITHNVLGTDELLRNNPPDIDAAIKKIKAERNKTGADKVELNKKLAELNNIKRDLPQIETELATHKVTEASAKAKLETDSKALSIYKKANKDILSKYRKEQIAAKKKVGNPDKFKQMIKGIQDFYKKRTRNKFIVGGVVLVIITCIVGAIVWCSDNYNKINIVSTDNVINISEISRIVAIQLGKTRTLVKSATGEDAISQRNMLKNEICSDINTLRETIEKSIIFDDGEGVYNTPVYNALGLINNAITPYSKKYGDTNPEHITKVFSDITYIKTRIKPAGIPVPPVAPVPPDGVTPPDGGSGGNGGGTTPVKPKKPKKDKDEPVKPKPEDEPIGDLTIGYLLSLIEREKDKEPITTIFEYYTDILTKHDEDSDFDIKKIWDHYVKFAKPKYENDIKNADDKSKQGLIEVHNALMNLFKQLFDDAEEILPDELENITPNNIPNSNESNKQLAITNVTISGKRISRKNKMNSKEDDFVTLEYYEESDKDKKNIKKLEYKYLKNEVKANNVEYLIDLLKQISKDDLTGRRTINSLEDASGNNAGTGTITDAKDELNRRWTYTETKNDINGIETLLLIRNTGLTTNFKTVSFSLTKDNKNYKPDAKYYKVDDDVFIFINPPAQNA